MLSDSDGTHVIDAFDGFFFKENSSPYQRLCGKTGTGQEL
jgi:hypothetical protein